MNSEKMLIHIGEGDARKTYEFDYAKLLNVEAIDMQRATGMPLKNLISALPQVDMAAITAVVWILRRREEPDLVFHDVEFSLGDLEVEFVEEAPVVPKGQGKPAKS